jgi:DNA-binding GntR family transcriptional regulator
VLREHITSEKRAIAQEDAPGRTELLGEFHVRIAELMGNEVLAQMLGQLISRCALITLMYQTPPRRRTFQRRTQSRSSARWPPAMANSPPA